MLCLKQKLEHFLQHLTNKNIIQKMLLSRKKIYFLEAKRKKD